MTNNLIEEIDTSSFHQLKYQFLAACCANFIILGQGCAIGWVSPSLPILESSESPFDDGEITDEEASWIGSLSSIGAAVGTLSFGFVANRLGSRNATLICALPLMMFWVLVMLSDYVWHIYVGRLLSGLTGGAFVCIQLFVADISDQKIRGTLGSFLSLYLNVGILLGYIGGSYLDYTVVPYVMIIFPTLFLFSFSLMPNTPQDLLKIAKYEDAEKSYMFYKNLKKDDPKLKSEFENLKSIAEQGILCEKLCIKDFLSPTAIKGLVIGPTVMAINQFSGTYVLVNYSTTIFSESGSNFDPNMSTIVFGILQILGTYCTTMLIDRLGRKFLLVVSASGSTIGLAIMGTFSYMSQAGYDVSDFNLVPVCSLSFVIFIASIGLIPIPYVIISEMLPRKIRNIGTSICTTTVSVFSFTMLKSFPHLLLNLQLYGCMCLFCTVAFTGIFVIILFVPETKGKCLDVLISDEETANNVNRTDGETRL